MLSRELADDINGKTSCRAGDIVPLDGAHFEETRTPASPDVLWQMIRASRS
jgi:hypothetical protein